MHVRQMLLAAVQQGTMEAYIQKELRQMSVDNQTGMIRISDDVVATIAGLAALETPGIAGMSGGISEGLAKRLSGKNAQKGVSAEVGQLEAAIDLRVIVHFGSKIQEVCRQLQENVKDAVENMTGLNVVEVNVKVEGVAFKEEETEEPVARIK
jgi:uncharacterized alkaline shock family protein YloU